MTHEAPVLRESKAPISVLRTLGRRRSGLVSSVSCLQYPNNQSSNIQSSETRYEALPHFPAGGLKRGSGSNTLLD